MVISTCLESCFAQNQSTTQLLSTPPTLLVIARHAARVALHLLGHHAVILDAILTATMIPKLASSSKSVPAVVCGTRIVFSRRRQFLSFRVSPYNGEADQGVSSIHVFYKLINEQYHDLNVHVRIPDVRLSALDHTIPHPPA